MSKVRQCDVCGEIIRGVNIYTLTKTSLLSFMVQEMDICDNCVDLIKKLRKEMEGGNNDNGFSKR